MTDAREILNIDQLSGYLGVPKSTLYRLVKEGKIPSHKVGKQWRFRREAVDRWLDQPPEPVPQTLEPCSNGQTGGSSQ